MKRNIVESYSIEEAFRALNKKPQSKVVEAAGQLTDNIIRRTLSRCKSEFEPIDSQVSFDGYVETVAGDLYAKYIYGGDFSGALLTAKEEAELAALETRVQTAANELLGTNYTLRSHMSESTKKVAKLVESAPVIPAPYDKYFEIVNYSAEELEGMASYLPGEVIEEYNAKILACVDPKDGYEDIFDSIYYLVDEEGDVYVAEIQGTASGTRIYSVDFEDYGITETLNFKAKAHLSESADSTYTAIILKDTVLAIDDVDSDGNHYDTVKDEFIPVTIKANSDREAIEKIAEYVPIVLDDYDYSEDELIDEINNAVFPIAFEDWNAYYYSVGDSNTAIISFKRPDGTELATESEIQAIDVSDAVKKYNEFYLPENSIESWGLKFDSITVGKQILIESANDEQEWVDDNAEAEDNFTTIAEIVPFDDFISGKTAIYFLKDFAGYTAELYIGVYNGTIYAVDPGNETADYICEISDITSYKDLSLKANFDSDDHFYDEKAVLINNFKYDNLTWAEFIQKFELDEI